jgi:hypothetical protein
MKNTILVLIAICAVEMVLAQSKADKSLLKTKSLVGKSIQEIAVET